MTIIQEPLPRNVPEYSHTPFRAGESPGGSRMSSRLSLLGAGHPRFDEILTPGALDFVCGLHRQFAGRRAELLAGRRRRRAEGAPFTFLRETADVRADQTWRVAPPAPGLEDRRCEISGSPNRKIAVGALNSGANVWMADFEDGMSPTWFNVIDGQVTLYDAVRRQIDFTDENGKRYELGEKTATIMVRPRGLHLTEKHMRMDGHSIVAAFVDFGLYFYHNALTLITNGSGPYFYLAKLQSHREARLWHDVFAWSEDALGIPRGTIRATCLVETFPAAFEMTEILHELREYSAGLNAGRWDYIFSVIKSFADDPTKVMPDRDKISMTVPFMRAYTELLVRTCHERGAHAIGGIAAHVPSAGNAEVTEQALAETRSDKTREAADGFDGSWVAHPALVPACREVFDAQLGDQPHQIARRRDDVMITETELNAISGVPGGVTLRGVRTNLRTSLAYLRSWVQGRGTVAIENLMEDAGTVEISRMQLWQWIRHGARTRSGVVITRELVVALLAEEVEQMEADTPETGHWAISAARDILEQGCLGEEFPSSLTSHGYVHYLVGNG